MATQKKVTRVSGGESAPQSTTFVPTADAKRRAGSSRTLAILLWIAAIAAEAGAIYVLLTSAKPLTNSSWAWMIGLIVVDLILVIVGSSLWKKANRLDPASRADKTRFFIQNQLGVIVSVIAFLPLVLLAFTNKELSGKEKGILGGIAAVALVIAGLASADFNPPSVEEYSEQTARIEELTGTNLVFWTKAGTRYHIYDDCPYINTDRTDEIFSGTVAQARELKNITQLCSYCEHRAEETPVEQIPQNE